MQTKTLIPSNLLQRRYLEIDSARDRLWETHGARIAVAHQGDLAAIVHATDAELEAAWRLTMMQDLVLWVWETQARVPSLAWPRVPPSGRHPPLARRPPFNPNHAPWMDW
ncbi:MAG: hypothetical protein LBK95_11900 [Bifidobacteriaceae bacterium]|jgi:hypothetical protein|nr:hypothetical protein [Bifidobacteriaceae bacterium]